MQDIKNIIDFNFNLVDYIDESWYSEIPFGDFIAKNRDKSESSVHLSNYLIGYFALSNQYVFEFPSEIKSLVFLSPDQQCNLIKRTGAVIKAEAIKKVILGSEIEALKADIGDDAYYYSLRRSSMFRKIHITENRVRYKPTTIGKLVIKSGADCFLRAISHLPHGVKQRLLIKMPHEWIRPPSYKDRKCTSGNLKLISAILKDMTPRTTSTKVATI